MVGVMHMSFRSLKGIITLSALFWICLIVVVHQKLTVQHRRMDKNVATLRHRTGRLLSIQCGNQTVEVKDRECFRRIEAIAKDENLETCFEAFMVNTKDNCAVLKYLVYVEGTCPIPDQSDVVFAADVWDKSLLLRSETLTRARCEPSLVGLVEKMEECGEVCQWMKLRIESMQSDWAEAIRQTAEKKEMEINNPQESDKKQENNGIYAHRRRLTILLHMGLLTKEYGLNFGEAAFAGGPLGELVQWADLLSALHALGHELVLSWSPQRLKTILKPPGDDQCRRAAVADIVFTDLVGLEQIKATLGSLYHYRCKLRVLDVYGTEPEYNHPRYNTGKGKAGTWGGKGLDPRQFFTHFPHSPDNSFLGFVVREGRATSPEGGNSDMALLYGKRMEALNGRGKHKFLEILHKYFKEIHATMRTSVKKSDPDEDGDHSLPNYVTNHGAMAQENFMQLLHRPRVYVGLEWPVEGPAALEAIANGVTFLNPRFLPPRDAHDGKPTNRLLTSQNPYAEKFIGEPYAYTFDMRDAEEVESILKKIKGSPRPNPRRMHEFTHMGFLERINAYLENQDFCSGILASNAKTGLTWKRESRLWPPLESLQVKESTQGESCADACSRHGLVCERGYFDKVNTLEQFASIGRKCAGHKTLPERNDDPNVDLSKIKLDTASDLCHAPSYDTLTSTCSLQSDWLLHSCACAPPDGVIRVCPCRTYTREQIALCDGCT